jgi:hypothetical protein
MKKRLGEGETSGISPEQMERMDSFVRHFEQESNVDPQHTGFYDQSAAYLSEIMSRGFDLRLDESEKFYGVFAGVCVALWWMDNLTDKGLSFYEASDVIKASLARLYPREF